MSEPLFHPGERAAHARAGVARPRAAIRDRMPDQHRLFFGLLPFLPIAVPAPDGAPVATILTGAPGFISSPDATTLRVAARPGPYDPAAPLLQPNTPIGLLGIDLATRRRNRANGIVRAVDADGVTVGVSQSFGNCPQYIQTRFWQPTPAQPRPAEHLPALDPEARALITASDTFFVATTSGAGGDPQGGMDISHRGGRPGFVSVSTDRLVVPDFHGNGYFNTLGNLLLDPRAALLFVDWSDGSVLHVQGTVDILWDDDGGFRGAERLWRLSVNAVWRLRGSMPLRWAYGALAPQTERTGLWSPQGSDDDPIRAVACALKDTTTAGSC